MALEEWLDHEDTIQFKKTLIRDRAAILEAWGIGDYTGPTTESTVQLNSRALGSVKAIDDILRYVMREEEYNSFYGIESSGFQGIN